MKFMRQNKLMLSCFQERNLDHGPSSRPVLQMADRHRRPSILQPDDDCNEVTFTSLINYLPFTEQGANRLFFLVF